MDENERQKAFKNIIMSFVRDLGDYLPIGENIFNPGRNIVLGLNITL